MRHKSWLDRMLTSIGHTLDRWASIMSTRDFWAAFAIASTLLGFLFAAGIMLTNFDVMRMRNCFDASNLNAYLMFNILLFFVFGGLSAIGEVFNYFDSKRRGLPHKPSALFWFVLITTALGSVGLVLLKESC